MPPVPAIRLSEPLERGQTTIFSTLNGGISIHRPARTPRPRPAPKSTGQANTVLGRHLAGGQNEKQVIKLFATIQLAQTDDGEPRDMDITNGRFEEDEEQEEDQYKYMPTKRYSYSREHKLAAIDYFQTT